MRRLLHIGLSDRGLVFLTVGVLLLMPVLASRPDWWPGFVALVLLGTACVALLWRRDVLGLSEVFWGAVLLRCAFLPLLPELTDDPFRYLWDGRLQLAGINPYRYRPEADVLASFRGEGLFAAMNSQSYYSIYPPLSQLTFLVGGAGSLLSWHVGYYLLKGLYMAAELGGVALLSRITSARNVLLYAWNPLVLVETAGQGHTDALLVPLLFGAVWAVQRGRGRTASALVAGAGLVKLYPFFLWPYLARRFGVARTLWPSALVVALLSAPYAAPYVLPHVKASVDLFAELFEFNAGPYYLVKHVLWWLTGADWSKTIGPLFRGLFLASLPVLYGLDARQGWSFRRAALVTIGLLFVLSTTVHPWYLLPLLGLGVLGERPAWPWIWLGALSAGTYLFYAGGPYWIWIILGWGGAACLALWLHGASIRRKASTWRRRLTRSWS